MPPGMKPIRCGAIRGADGMSSLIVRGSENPAIWFHASLGKRFSNDACSAQHHAMRSKYYEGTETKKAQVKT